MREAPQPVATASLVRFPLAEKANGTFVLSVESSNKLKIPPTLGIYEDFTKGNLKYKYTH